MKKEKLQKTAIISYITAIVLFLLLFIYMGVFEHISINKARPDPTCQVLEEYSVKEIEDSSAPIGIRKEYRWTMKEITENDTSLSFYLVHHYAEVYFDGELVYSLMPADTNRIGKSISSNWITIPLYASDSGKEVRVVVTPVYESVRNREIVFQIGSFFELYRTQLQRDLPQLVLSSACLLLGIVVMIIQLILIYSKKMKNWDVFYLGNFLMIIGLWKTADTRFSPFIFGENSLVMGYLTIGALFLASIPMTLYLQLHFSENKVSPLLIASLTASGTSFVVFLCQVLGIADFRQTLTLSHVNLIFAALCMVLTLLFQKRKKSSTRIGRSWVLTFLLVFGLSADLVCFYVQGSSSGLVFSLLAIFVYTLAQFTISVLDTNRKAYTDAHTGLFNRRRWDTLIDSMDSFHDPVGMMMLDLNGLKYVNDTMGHDAGDKMIFNFVNILRNTIPPTNTICRWGGDEFTVLITNADKDIMEHYVEQIRTAATFYNESGEKPALYFAAGYALSTEFPELSLKELLQKADERMYLDKEKWYMEKGLSGNIDF